MAGQPAEASSGHVDLDTLNARWRLAIHAAQEALQAIAHCNNASLRISDAELQRWTSQLATERSNTARLIDTIALNEHLPLHRELDTPWTERRMLGLGDEIVACVFDLEGVLTGSAAVHAAAWADTFDPFLAHRAELVGERFAPYKPFTSRDYFAYLHEQPRMQGILGFLASRGISLPQGVPQDPEDAETIFGLARRKNEALLRRIATDGVHAFASSLFYLECAAEAGVPCAVVTASANARIILGKAGLSDLVGPLIDGNAIAREGLRSKPAPDTLEAACDRLGVVPAHAAAFETTASGITAAKRAGIGLIVGVERNGGNGAVREADVRIGDLEDLLDPALKQLSAARPECEALHGSARHSIP
jgi:beta-phosphoglucomutase-like phosphatase (HAD superfamily)